MRMKLIKVLIILIRDPQPTLAAYFATIHFSIFSLLFSHKNCDTQKINGYYSIRYQEYTANQDRPTFSCFAHDQ